MFWEFTQWLSLFQLVWSITSFGYRKGIAIYGGWTRQTTINLKIAGYVGVIILIPVLLTAAFTISQWLPPVLHLFA